MENIYLVKNYRDIFVVIDGPNPAGKTTIAERVIEYLRNKYSSKEIIHIRELSDSDIGNLVRKYSELERYFQPLLIFILSGKQFRNFF